MRRTGDFIVVSVPMANPKDLNFIVRGFIKKKLNFGIAKTKVGYVVVREPLPDRHHTVKKYTALLFNPLTREPLGKRMFGGRCLVSDTMISIGEKRKLVGRRRFQFVEWYERGERVEQEAAG